MTTKPEFTKPFDLAAAKAGAPYCCRNGDEATILKWERRSSDIYQLLGIRDADDKFVSWLPNGNFYKSSTSPMDLVMIPLGVIDGKPVFVGDEITSPDCKGNTTAHHNMNFGEGSTWTWPAPAMVYPETLIAHSALFEEYAARLRALGYRTVAAESSGLAAVANAALRHAIDAGQVVLPGDTAARDMAVAVAVNNAAAGIALKAQFVFALDLPTIIAGVAK